MNDPRGSQWRKWDLHVHTPASIYQHYGGESDKIWDKYISELEDLPPEIKVLGINDYFFIDGYKRLFEEKEKNGRLQNINLMVPVIELRVDKFGGSGHHLNEVNFHVIFDQLEPEVIEGHFINTLSSGYKLEPKYKHLGREWVGLPTRASLTELGQKIFCSTPPEKRNGSDTPLKMGANNLCLSLDLIEKSLGASCFDGKCITGIGKTEWADTKWNDHSIAEKKDMINSVDLVFTAVD